jgi:hypothetical protein
VKRTFYRQGRRNDGGVRRAASLLIWAALLEGFWALLVGTQQDTELAGGLPAAVVGAIFAEVLRSRGLLPFTTDFRLLAKAWRLPWLLVYDFFLVTWVLISSLAHGRRVRGEWVRIPFPMQEGSVGNWQRAFGTATSNNAANALVVDFDGDEAVAHALRPNAFTARSLL